jgi:ATP-dependent RNA helicase DeaD
VWFRLNIGRAKNADPRWLLPLICRQGRIVKQDVGAIRILERETHFEIDAAAADRFVAALRQVQNPEGRIEPLGADGPRDRASRPDPRTAAPRKFKPGAGARGKKPKDRTA